MRVLPLNFHGAGPIRRNVQVDHLVIAGWTGRDKAALEKHIAELEALGVKRPASTPIFYRAAAARLTIDTDIEVLGEPPAERRSSCCCSTTAGSGSAPDRTTPTARWRNTG